MSRKRVFTIIQVGNLSDQEMVDYLNSRIDYLETVVGVVKKRAQNC